MLIHDKPTLYVLFCKHLLPSNYDSIPKRLGKQIMTRMTPYWDITIKKKLCGVISSNKLTSEDSKNVRSCWRIGASMKNPWVLARFLPDMLQIPFISVFFHDYPGFWTAHVFFVASSSFLLLSAIFVVCMWLRPCVPGSKSKDQYARSHHLLVVTWWLLTNHDVAEKNASFSNLLLSSFHRDPLMFSYHFCYI